MGTGIIRMQETCRKSGLPEPCFEEIGSFFKVTLFRPGSAIPDSEQEVFGLLKEQGAMGSREIAERLKIHRNTVLKRLKWFEQNGFIQKRGSGTKVKYGV